VPVQGHSADFDDTVRRPHTAVSRADLITDGKVIRELEVHAGAVTADRTAAQMRSFSIDVLDRDGTLLPTGMGSDLAPFGARVQLYRGVRISNTDTIAAQYDATHAWTAQTPTGSMNGVTIDVDGGLVLGP
jgi:hypothetical protein